jgi:4'-phosphopantetheinyl transferase
MNHARKQKLHYLTQHQNDLPPHEHWLTRQEAAVLAGFKFPKRRRDWLLGRWTAKSALSRFPQDPDRSMTDWQIVADSDGAPMILEDGRKTNIPISLSHSGNLALCVLAEEPMQMGCDLETIEERSRAFEETFFTDSELAMLDRHPGSDRARLVTLVWSAKESALKALRLGLKADTRRVRVDFCSNNQAAEWNRIEVEDSLDGRYFRGWWREQNGMVMTILSDQALGEPTEL